MKKLSIFLFAVLFVSVVMSGCASISKLVEKKKYDYAIDRAVGAFKKTKRNAEDIKALETAFNESTKNDLQMIQLLKDERMEENWLKINELYNTIHERQQKVQPLSPVVADNGYAAHFNFIDVQAEINESAAKSAELCYNKGATLLQEATDENNRFKAREAYYEFAQMEKYDKDFKDGSTLKRKASEQGLTYVLLTTYNDTREDTIFNFIDCFFAAPLYENEKWTRYIHHDYGTKVHYRITATFQTAKASGDNNDSREFEETAVVQDGVEYIRDANGQLVLDSKGDPTTKPKMVEVNCMIKEIKHHKTATVSILMEIWDNTANESVAEKLISGESTYEHYTAAIISGDPRAASAATNAKIKAPAAEFPTDKALIGSAASKLCQPTRDFFDSNENSIE